MPSEAGDYQIEVTRQGKHIDGSPASVKVTPKPEFTLYARLNVLLITRLGSTGATIPESCQVGKACDFVVQCKNVPSGNIKVVVEQDGTKVLLASRHC